MPDRDSFAFHPQPNPSEWDEPFRDDSRSFSLPDMNGDGRRDVIDAQILADAALAEALGFTPSATYGRDQIDRSEDGRDAHFHFMRGEPNTGTEVEVIYHLNSGTYDILP